MVDRLIEHGADVVVIDDLSTSDGSNLSPKAKFLKRNLAVTNLEDVVADVQYVFHVGAVPRTQYCVENPIECHVVNALGTLRLLDACRQYAKSLKRFVYSSSCAVYGHQVAMPIKEDVRRNHGTPYALQKLIGEQYVCMYATLYGVPGISLIYSNVFGTRRQTEKGAYPNVLAAFSKQKKELGRLLITGDGEQTRDFIHVYDVVDANLKAALSDVSDGSALNISSGCQTSINAIAGFFDCPVDYIEPRPGEARHLVLDPTKARDILGWSCKISLEEGIKLYFSS